MALRAVGWELRFSRFVSGALGREFRTGISCMGCYGTGFKCHDSGLRVAASARKRHHGNARTSWPRTRISTDHPGRLHQDGPPQTLIPEPRLRTLNSKLRYLVSPPATTQARRHQQSHEHKDLTLHITRALQGEAVSRIP